MNSAKVNIGTSGWYYQEWVGPFYPKEIKMGDLLNYYTRFFSTVEINLSFYRLPDRETFCHWANEVPEGFIFSVKANRYITHLKKLKDSFDPLNRFLEVVFFLKDHLGPILFQLPPRWKCNPERLEAFLQILPAGNHYVFEFRDPSWWNEAVYHLLKIYRVSFCIFDLSTVLSPIVSTSELIYIRLHGPNHAYCGQYSQETLMKWAKKIKEWSDQNKTIYCYFDNDQSGFAIKNALGLKEILKGDLEK